MAELGLTPSARARLRVPGGAKNEDIITEINFVSVYEDKDGKRIKETIPGWKAV
ncbi:hypothetical protein RLO149_c022180 [Roseobacter litoralis Och 149]|uniref:Uncharacterized protein n=1 Tax=Roseobacter litoralis (strain ATCC 49566 / DSM 6996 / JCM 21268 / NBRC 15278 / OCh 149) TaxID=391595 RepID=F7ZA41_ROSLO|nr:hypothetical protein RLO149_c022180 [Roseobacter litoralis Och 149]